MSGVIANGSLVLSDMMITASGATDPYVVLSFPSRVKVTAVSFTINQAGLGSQGDGLEYKLYVQKGKQSVGFDPGEEWNEDIVNFFPGGVDDKPTIICEETKFLSNVVAPQESAEWTCNGPTNYTADVAQMDTDEYLVVWVQYHDGDDTNILAYPNGWDDVRATVTFSYTGAYGVD